MVTSRQEFDGRLIPLGRWTCIKMPFFAPAVFGSRSRVRVRGTLNGCEFHSFVFPTSDGGFFMMVDRALRAQAEVMMGDLVRVVIERDDEPRYVEVPSELEQALVAHPVARSRFERLSAARKREIVRYVDNGKGDDKRASRIERTIDRLMRLRRRKA